MYGGKDMYLDYLLFIVGIISCIAAIVLVLYLSFSKKKSIFYRKLLKQDTEKFDAYSSTISQLSKTSTKHVEDTESLGNLSLDDTAPMNQVDTGLFQNSFVQNSRQFGINMSILEGKYIIEREIYGGGMSRIFLVTHTKLGNQWILKYIDKKSGSLTNEENILKLLNHISLPKIIDIFHDDKGIYIVQSFIEGISLDKVISVCNNIGQSMILDWAEQLAQVLSYLHTLKPLPIIHCDLKPSNIMVTHDNKLVLIDFGISKRLDGYDSGVMAVTYKYAAPEQLKHKIQGKKAELIYERFGELSNERFYWGIDERTDIYSYGVILFELATGRIPTFKNRNYINEHLSKEFIDVILKCIQENPKDRYQDINEILNDLHRIKSTKTTMVRSLVLRRVATSLATVAFLVSGSSFASGAYIMQQENLSLLYMEPNAVKISEQQSAEITIQKIRPNGKVIILKTNEIKWSLDNNNVAKIEGNRIAGMNTGRTELVGKYRNKIITLNVDVVKRMDGIVDISLCYKGKNEVKRYFGTGEREHIDGDIQTASFVSPESIAKTDDGSIYFSDAGVLKKIKDGQVESISFEPEYITPRIIRAFNNELFILSNSWEEEGRHYYGIIKLTEDGVEGLYIADAVYTNIEDFTFTEDGELYFIENNMGAGITSIKSINITSCQVKEICEVENDVKAIAVDQEANIYLAIPERGLIQKINSITKEIEYFAGVDRQRHFIDGSLPLLYSPIRIHYDNGSLYVLDFNIIRKITIDNGIAAMMETIAGEVSTENNPQTIEGKADSIVFARSSEMDFIVDKSSILLTDPKKSIIWELNLEEKD